MASIIIVGDGPGGLSAALFLAKAGQDVTVFGMDRTGMNHAYLYNYLGIPEIDGPSFQQLARFQVTSFGARIVDEEVEEAAVEGSGFSVSADGGCRGDYLVLRRGEGPAAGRSARPGAGRLGGGGRRPERPHLHGPCIRGGPGCPPDAGSGHHLGRRRGGGRPRHTLDRSRAGRPGLGHPSQDRRVAMPATVVVGAQWGPPVRICSPSTKPQVIAGVELAPPVLS